MKRGWCGRERWWSRRRFLATVGSGCLGFGLAGCGRVDSYEFRADPVVLPTAARARLAYEERRRERQVLTATGSVGAGTIEASIESMLAVYRPTDPDGDGQDLGFVTLSTPSAAVNGNTLNPIARLSPAGLLRSDSVADFLAAIGLDARHASGPAGWDRGPELLASRDGVCLDEHVMLESYAGILDSETRPVAFAHLVRVEDRSIVFVGTVHRHPRQTATGSFVGPDGVLPRAKFDAIRLSFGAVLERLAYA